MGSDTWLSQSPPNLERDRSKTLMYDTSRHLDLNANALSIEPADSGLKLPDQLTDCDRLRETRSRQRNPSREDDGGAGGGLFLDAVEEESFRSEQDTLTPCP